MVHAGNQNAECGMQNVEWRMEKNQPFIPNSEIRTPNLPCPISPPHSAEASRSPQEEGPPDRCFLPGRSLPPGHNPSSLEMSIPPEAGPPAEPGRAGGLA
jgi:hypothetical protein